MEKILLIGAGALARDFVDLFVTNAFVGAYVDPQFAKAETLDGVRILTDWKRAVARATSYILATSSITHRERARSLAAVAGLPAAPPLISPMARIAKTATLGRGCVITHFSAVGPGARLGPDCLIMHGVVVGHDSVVEENVVFCPGVCVGGYVRIGAGCFVGTNSVLAPKVNIGCDGFISAGAACLRDAPANSLLMGNPAKRMPFPRENVTDEEKLAYESMTKEHPAHA